MGHNNYLRAELPDHVLVPGGNTWRDDAACRNNSLPPSTWDDSLMPGDRQGGENGMTRAKRITQAQQVCRTCPVAAGCLSDVDMHYDEGVRGGVDIRTVRECGACQEASRRGLPFPELAALHSLRHDKRQRS